MMPLLRGGSCIGRPRGEFDSAHPGRLSHCIGSGNVVQRHSSYVHSCCRDLDLHVSAVVDLGSDRSRGRALAALLP